MTMEEAVSTHVLDHLVNGPVAHRDLMDAAQSVDAELTALRQQVADLRAALEEIGETPNYPCYRCGGNGATRRKVEMEWEHEFGEYGTKLSSWPVFTVDPPCAGPDPDWTGDDERKPFLCPWHEEYDAQPCDQQQGLIEVHKLVKIARRVLAATQPQEVQP